MEIPKISLFRRKIKIATEPEPKLPEESQRLVQGVRVVDLTKENIILAPKPATAYKIPLGGHSNGGAEHDRGMGGGSRG